MAAATLHCGQSVSHCHGLEAAIVMATGEEGRQTGNMLLTLIILVFLVETVRTKNNNNINK